MRIVLTNPALQDSSAARDRAVLARMWAERDHDVTLITVAPRASDRMILDGRVERVALRPSEGALRRIARWPLGREIATMAALRTAISNARPHVVVSNWHRMNVATLLATPRGVPVVVEDHQEYRGFQQVGPLWERLRRRTYRRANAAVAINPDEARWMETYVTPERVHVIPLTLDASARIRRDVSSRTVLGAGRLLGVKGFDVLLEAFAASRARESGWTLRIVGEGPDRRRLETMADALGIATLVSLPGYTHAIWDEYAAAGMFVLSSHLEAFGLVLPEAMAAGVPVISTDCPTGPRHIVSDGVDGLLVPPGDAAAMAAAIDRLAADEGLRERLGSRGREAAERYAPERVFRMWDDLVGSVVAGSVPVP